MSDTSLKPGSISWIDLTVPQADQVRAFYEAVGGWKAHPLDMGDYADYTMHPAGESMPVAGICHARGSNAGLPPQWLIYITVDELEARLLTCEARGGRVVQGIRSMGSYGRMAVIQDPAGAVAALIEPAARVAAEPSLLDRIPRPAEGDFPEFFRGYIDRTADTTWASALLAHPTTTSRMVRMLGEVDGDYRYAEGKWSVKEVMGHLIDTERVFTYRALCIARGEKASLPAFEQDDYVRTAGAARRTLASLADEFDAVRSATRALVASLDDESLARKGISSGRPVTAAALVYATAGHEAHHLALFRDKYGLQGA
ncbi:MAG: DinB family protein [Rhodothermales bacterium]